MLERESSSAGAKGLCRRGDFLFEPQCHEGTEKLEKMDCSGQRAIQKVLSTLVSVPLTLRGSYFRTDSPQLLRGKNLACLAMV